MTDCAVDSYKQFKTLNHVHVVPIVARVFDAAAKCSIVTYSCPNALAIIALIIVAMAVDW